MPGMSLSVWICLNCFASRRAALDWLLAEEEPVVRGDAMFGGGCLETDGWTAPGNVGVEGEWLVGWLAGEWYGLEFGKLQVCVTDEVGSSNVASTNQQLRWRRVLSWYM